jgi:peptidyl-prolyl cis-trans isomerase B (cyclophilin B)
MMKFFLKAFLLSAILFSTVSVHAQVKSKGARKTTTRKKTVAKTNPSATAEQTKKTGVRVKITTDMGDIVIRLYDKTPKHRDNFIKLVKEHFYDSLLFHRVINTFMIQGGDPKSKNAAPGIMLGDGDVGYTIPAEFDTTLYHKRGALCAARTDNPEKASSGCQFYIVQGRLFNDGELNMISRMNKVYFSSAKKMTYKMAGGTPKLDMNYTVFGEVESGMDAVDKIAMAPRDSNNRPLTDIRMKMELLDETVMPAVNQ